MALSPTARGVAQVVEAVITLPATNTGTVDAITVPAGTVVVGAGLEILGAPGDVTTYTVDLQLETDTTVIANDLNLDAATANTKFYGADGTSVTAAEDVLQVVATVSGSPTAVEARVFAIVVDVNDMGQADEVDRDQIA